MLKRHSKSNAVVNTDVQALNKYKQERALHRKVQNLDKEINEVKNLLQAINERLDKLESK